MASTNGASDSPTMSSASSTAAPAKFYPNLFKHPLFNAQINDFCTICRGEFKNPPACPLMPSPPPPASSSSAAAAAASSSSSSAAAASSSSSSPSSPSSSWRSPLSSLSSQGSSTLRSASEPASLQSSPWQTSSLQSTSSHPASPQEASEPTEAASILKLCDHAFHSTCIMAWLQYQEENGQEKTCPYSYCNAPAYTRVDEAKYFVHQLDEKLEDIRSNSTPPPQHAGPNRVQKSRPRATLSTKLNENSYAHFIDAWCELYKIYKSLPRSGLDPARYTAAKDTDIFRKCLGAILLTMDTSCARRRESLIDSRSMLASQDDYGATLFLEISEKIPLGQACESVHIDACIRRELEWTRHKGDLELFFGRVLAYMELEQDGMIRIPRILR